MGSSGSGQRRRRWGVRLAAGSPRRGRPTLVTVLAAAAAFAGAVGVALSLGAANAMAGGPVGAANRSHDVFLAASIDPPTLPADGQTSPALYLELLDETGAATELDVPTVVSLTSSDPTIAKVEPAVTIPSGTALVQIPLTTTDKAGQVTVNVKSDGLAATSAALATTAAASAAGGGKLAISVAPGQFFLGGTGPAWVSVVVESATGAPVQARQPVAVDLVSSAPGVVQLPTTVTIPAGAYQATVPIHPGAAGAVTLTALAPGFVVGTVQTSVLPAGAAPATLKLWVVPPVLLPGTVPHLVAQAVDGQGRPVPYPCGDLLLASDNPGVLDVTRIDTPSCTRGQESVAVDARAAAGTGTAALAVAQSGLIPATADVSVLGSAPRRLEASVAPEALAYGAADNGWLVIRAVDAKDGPVDTESPLRVTLSGVAGGLPSTVTIPQGGSFVAVPIRGLSAGASPEITFSGSDLPGGTVTLASGTAARIGTGRSRAAQSPTLRLLGFGVPVLWIALVLGLVAVGLAVALMAPARRPAGRFRQER